MYINHNFFIHSSVDGHLGSFHNLAIVESAAINSTLCRCPYASALLYPLGKLLAVLLLGHRVGLFLIFWGTSTLFSREAALFCIPTNSVKGFPFLHILSSIYSLLICSFWPLWLAWGDIWVWFWFVFPWWGAMLSIFPCALAIRMSSFIFFLFFFFNIYLFLRQRETEHERGEGQRERETQNLKQTPGSELSAQSLMRGLNSRTVRSWPERSRTLNRLSHPGAPGCLL